MQDQQEVSVKPTVTPSRVGDRARAPKQMRTFQQILNEEKVNRNIVEIKLSKMLVDNDGVMSKAKRIYFEDVSVLIFDVIGIKPEHCASVALSTARYDTKEVKLKPGVDPTQYCTKDSPLYFKDHQVEVRPQSASSTRITFKNVPFNIPDEEIINLCKCYGEPVDNLVQYDMPSKATRGVPGSTRLVEMKMIAGKQVENYYWMEGPLDSDRGCRITVLHNGQLQQCSHCLRRKDSCPGGGMGKLCESLIGDYMKHLKLHHNYTSLKMQYQQEKFPLLSGPRQQSDGFGHMVEKVDEEEEMRPGGELSQGDSKDARIAHLETQLSDHNVVRQKLTETKAKLYAIRKETRAKTCDLPQDFFNYDEAKDEVCGVDETKCDHFKFEM